jgi:ribosomal protein S18 acetylase RimI-like enzyme
MDSVHSYSQIQDAIVVIKSHRKKFMMNFYISEERCDLLIRRQLIFYVNMQECMFILQKDHNFYHVYYIAVDKNALMKSLEILTKKYSNDIFISDIVGVKTAVDEISSVYEQLGFEKYIGLYRMSRTKNLNEPQQLSEKIEYATLEHTERIQLLLEKYFDPCSEQIPLTEEIQKWIETKNIVIVAEKENIAGLVIFEINGLTSYLRYWFVHPDYRDKKIGSALLRRFFHECRATKRQLFWVIESNENAIARYKHYGFESEQLFDQIMIRR